MAGFPPSAGIEFTKTQHHQVPAFLKPSLQLLKRPFVVCITGASRGIGAETAKAFAEAGAIGLILTARTESALQSTREACQNLAKSSSDIKISVLAADSGSADSAQRIAQTIKSEHGRLDCLINNAGIMSTNASAFGKLDAMDDDQFQNVTQVNYIGRIHMIKCLIPIMLETQDSAKAIINITSMSSHFTSGTPVPFNISELATNRLTEALAEMYRDDGVVAYAVNPGAVLTTLPSGFPEMFKGFLTDDAGLCGAFILWLLEERREWLSGRYMSANWDVDELEHMKDDIVSQDKLKFRMVV